MSNEIKVLSLDDPGITTALAKRIKDDIDEYCVKTYDGGHRTHLGASLIGRDCKRYLWYVFRWCLHEKTDGRQQRLFNRGHREEARFIEWLEGIGFKLWFENRDLPPNEKGEYPQYRISGVNGHFGGSLDGIAILPERYNIPGPILVEFKTNATGAGFNNLLAERMPVAKPEHFAQTSTYGYKYGFSHVAYFNICKNDDNLHVEVTKLDHNLGMQMELKAEQIIMSQVPPPRLSDNSTFHKCQYCAMKDICHKGAVVERNCRSCKHATPVENAEWHCSVHNGIIPKNIIPIACNSYKSINDNV